MTRANRNGRERDNGMETQIAFEAHTLSFRDAPPELKVTRFNSSSSTSQKCIYSSYSVMTDFGQTVGVLLMALRNIIFRTADEHTMAFVSLRVTSKDSAEVAHYVISVSQSVGLS